MKKVTVSAPGKLMLFGEHAVVYNHPCIVTSVNQRIHVTIEQITEKELHIHAPDVQLGNYKKSLAELGQGNIPKGAQFIEQAVQNFFENFKLETGIKVITKSEFSSLFGFGSSSASTVCVIKALAELFNLQITKDELFNISYKTVIDIQKTGSGFDIATAIYGGTIYYIKGKPVEQLSLTSLPLTVAYSGVKADTATLVNKVAELKQKEPELINGLFNNIAKIVNDAKVYLQNKDWKMVGQLMNHNQLYLDQLDIMTDTLSTLISAAKKTGAYGAKISGAGGGDCVIVLAPEHKSEIEASLEKNGAQIIQVETNVEGVRVEE